MSVLNQDQAINVITSPVSEKYIRQIKVEESQLRVFTEELSEIDLTKEIYWKLLHDKMKSRSDKKFKRVIQFARFPLPIIQLSESILSDFYRVFEGKNRYFNVEADREINLLTDWMNENNPVKWIENHARGVFKNKPNSFVVADRDDQGEVYLIYVDSDRLIDAVFVDGSSQLEYIAFIHSVSPKEGSPKVTVTQYSVYDSERFYVFSRDSDKDDLVLVSDNEHGIGYCPARAFISTQTVTHNPFKRKVAFSSSLSKLEDWTQFDIYRNYVDHYAPFPVTESAVQKCANQDCENGIITTEVINEDTNDVDYKTERCSICEGANGGNHIYPGTHIGVKLSEDGEKHGSGVFRMIFPDANALKYVPEKLDDLEVEIRLKTVGVNTVLEREAVNEQQVKGSFSSMETILIRNKTELDDLYTWVIQTVGKLFYSDIKLSIQANFGTEFYLADEKTLQERYKQAKAIGLPIEEQLMIYTQLIETKYKGNTEKIQRQKMLLKLDPLPLVSQSEALGLFGQNLIDQRELNLKINFLNFINRFELENTPITQFGLNLQPYQRIKRIREILNIYNNENIESKQLGSS